MSTKLTLTIEESVIRRAKVYAKWKKTSISKLVEAYLDELSVMKLPNERE